MGKGIHWVALNPKVAMAFLAPSTLPGENLNTGETEDSLGNLRFSRVSFLALIE